MTSIRLTVIAAFAALLLHTLPCSATQVSLPKPALKGSVSVEEALAKRRSIRSYSAAPLTIQQVSQLLWAAQGITAPGGKRTAPSAHGLYPLTLYLVAGAVEGLAPGIYRYTPEGHSLEDVAQGDLRAKLVKAAGMQGFIGDAPVMAIICVNYEAMGRFGERGRAFSDFEVGHAAQNLSLETVALGLGTVPIGSFDAAALGKALGLSPQLSAVYLFPVGHQK
jgi:SagB-type dehydrogenase family enzyme